MTSGQRAALKGLDVERVIAQKFNEFATDKMVQGWLKFMGFPTTLIRSVRAQKMGSNDKTDLLIIITNSEGQEITTGLSIKSCSNKWRSGQLTRFKVEELGSRFGMPSNLIRALEQFTGHAYWECVEKRPRRDYFFTFSEELLCAMIDFFGQIKYDLIRWMFTRGDPSLHYMLGVFNTSNQQPLYSLKRMDDVVDYFAEGGCQNH